MDQQAEFRQNVTGVFPIESLPSLYPVFLFFSPPSFLGGGFLLSHLG